MIEDVRSFKNKIKKIMKENFPIFEKCINNITCISPNPIILLGNQKSGTSAIAHLIAEYGNLSKTIDIPEFWPPNLYDLLTGKSDLKSVIMRCKKRFHAKVIKEPNLTFFYEDLRSIFPKAYFVFIVRDPRSNIRSILNYLRLPGNLDRIVPGNIWDKDYIIMFDTWLWGLKSFSHYVDILSARWNKAAEVYLSHKKDNIFLIRYEDFCNDKIGEIENLSKQIGISRAKDISDIIDIQYQPKGNNNVTWIDFFSKDNLSKIENICLEHMSSFGYEPILL